MRHFKQINPLFYCGLLLALLAVNVNADPEIVERGSCVITCGTGFPACAAGYSCQSNGCGAQCFPDTKTKRGACIIECGTDRPCAAGYTCKYNGCGTQCYANNAKRGTCIVACGIGGAGEPCAPGFTCRSNGCGTQCFPN